MKVEIRDYRGVERADIDLSQIALVAGNNEMGKSCVAEATRAALTGNPIPIAGVLKKDAGLLVRDGSESGYATVALGESSRTVGWPGCTLAASEECGFAASDYASGLTHVLDLNLKDRSKVLASYMKSVPTKEDIEHAAADAGYSEAAIAKIVESIEAEGWDATYAKTREYTVTLKGQWQGVTGEKYGAKKGESYRPEEGGAVRGFLAECLETAESAVLDTAGAVAVSEAEVAALQRTADVVIENKIDLNDKLNNARDQLTKVQADRAVQPDDPASSHDQPDSLGCPQCGAALSLLVEAGSGRSLIPYKAPAKEKPLSAEVIQRRDALDERVVNTAATVAELEDGLKTAQRMEKDAANAKSRLDEIAKAPKLDEAAVELAKDAVSDARSTLTDFDNKVRAHKIHGDLAKNDLLIKVLAPDGLRKRILAVKLGTFNEALNALCHAAGWPSAYLDENLECHYGKRPLWAASVSGQWRARAIIQVAMALMDGSDAVILDGADMLDQRGRNGLFKMLEASGRRALVCMTFSGREKVPDLKKADLGVSYWIENGVAEELG